MDNISEGERRLLAAFRQLGEMPKADTKEDLQQWLESYATQTKEESHDSVAGGGVKPSHAVFIPQTPRVSIFSGQKRESDATFELWRYEVRCLQQQGYAENIILEAVRRSLRGEPAHVAMRLGPTAPLNTLLAKLENIFGMVQGSESVMAELYNATQGPGEDVAEWGCRLEDLVARGVNAGRIPVCQADEILRSRFWQGLHQDLRDMTGHKFDSSRTFDDLRRQIRQFEVDRLAARPPRHSHTQTPKHVKVAQAAKTEDDLRTQVQKLTEQVEALTSEVRARDRNRNTSHSHMRGRGRGQTHPGVVCWRCGERGHVQARCQLNGHGPARSGNQ